MCLQRGWYAVSKGPDECPWNKKKKKGKNQWFMKKKVTTKKKGNWAQRKIKIWVGENRCGTRGGKKKRDKQGTKPQGGIGGLGKGGGEKRKREKVENNSCKREGEMGKNRGVAEQIEKKTSEMGEKHLFRKKRERKKM